MKRSGKKFTIVGNWKMNPDTLDEARELFSSISRRISKFSRVNVVIAAPTPFIFALSARRSVGRIHLSAQDVSAEPRGARTGSVSAGELRSVGAEYAIVGHSERRAMGDSDDIVGKKVNQTLAAGLRAIVCVGEKERDKHAHYLREIREQITAILSKLSNKKNVQWLCFAYEPVYAVGQSFDHVLSPTDIHEMSIYIKKVSREIVGKKLGLKIPVFYGGALSEDSAEKILAESSIDGLLVGRESLHPQAFTDIIKYANKLS